MKIDKTFIIYNKENEDSVQYLQTAMESCVSVGLDNITAFDGYYNEDSSELWHKFGIHVKPICNKKASNCSASHYLLWSIIAQNPDYKVFMILEHDAIVLEKPDFSVEDNVLYTLGYKFRDVNELRNRTNERQETIEIESHEGAHAYIITPSTARKLLLELKELQPNIAIDDVFFLRHSKNCKSDVPLKIVSPTPAVAWLRKSTIWTKASTLNKKIVAKLK